MRTLACDGGDVLSATWFDPGHFTVSGFVTDQSISSLVLIHHRRHRRWLQPGGHIDPEDATLVEALRREIAEETGVTELAPERPALFDVDIHDIPARGEQPPHLHLDLRFHVVTRTTELAPSPEVAGAEWVTLGNVVRWTDDLSVLRLIGFQRGVMVASRSQLGLPV